MGSEKAGVAKKVTASPYPSLAFRRGRPGVASPLRCSLADMPRLRVCPISSSVLVVAVPPIIEVTSLLTTRNALFSTTKRMATPPSRLIVTCAASMKMVMSHNGTNKTVPVTRGREVPVSPGTKLP